MRMFLLGGVGRTVVQLEQAAVPAERTVLSEWRIHWACIESEAGRGEHHLCQWGVITAHHDGLRSALRSGCVRRWRLPADQSAMQWGDLPEVTVLLLCTVESASLWTLIYRILTHSYNLIHSYAFRFNLYCVGFILFCKCVYEWVL
jgi:hypothetical protein